MYFKIKTILVYKTCLTYKKAQLSWIHDEIEYTVEYLETFSL